MKAAFRKAEEYDVGKSPYGFPVYPYLWRSFPDRMAIRLEMGYRGANRLVADFGFEFQNDRGGICVHVTVWVVKPTVDPSIAGFASLPSKDTRQHVLAAGHLKGTLFGQQTRYTVETPELDEFIPPPPPDA